MNIENVKSKFGEFGEFGSPMEFFKDECTLINSEPFSMVIKTQEEWSMIASVVNRGIDGHLEAFIQSTFDSNTGRCEIHYEEMHIFLRRLIELATDDADLFARDIVSVVLKG